MSSSGHALQSSELQTVNNFNTVLTIIKNNSFEKAKIAFLFELTRPCETSQLNRSYKITVY